MRRQLARRIAGGGAALGGLALLALLAIGALGSSFLVGESRADLENPGRDTEPRVFASPRDRIRVVVPRAWRATDQPSYPNVILWMMRSQPPAQIALTSEAFTREQYCAWPPVCRASAAESPTAKMVCAMRAKLTSQRLRVGPPQAGPKENHAAGMPSMWFEYDDGKRFMRHAVALTADRIYSLVLSSPTNEARAAHARAFEQMLRTMRPMTPDEAASPDAGVANVARMAEPSDAAIDAMALVDAPPLDAGLAFESAPPPPVNPVGPCR